MLVVMKHGASETEVQAVVDEIERLGYEARPMPGKTADNRWPHGERRRSRRRPDTGTVGRARDHPRDQAVQTGVS